MRSILGVGVLAMAVMAGCAQVQERSGPISQLPSAPAVVPVVTVAESVRPDLHQAAKDAVSGDPAIAAIAIRTLRGAGYAGLDALLETHKEKVQALTMRSAPARLLLSTGPAAPASPDASMERLTQAIDAVALQKDAAYSRLYWHASFENAKREAQATGKPILSLRMLGNLNEELSCANSRFFRTMLYSNRQVSTFLREHYVLHWESVRPVPVITIDMGDGRKIVRTITGNSIHYVLDSEGRLIDGIPGLYGPQAFLLNLAKARDFAARTAKASDEMFRPMLLDYATARTREIDAAWKRDLELGRLPEGKVPAELTEEQWKVVASLHAAEAVLDGNSLALIQSKGGVMVNGVQENQAPRMEDAMARTFRKAAIEMPMVRMIVNTDASMDTVRNEYTMRTTIYQWLSNNTMTLTAFNNQVYAELFKTPATDPWMGLSTPDAFSALPNNGLITATVTPRR